MWNILVNAWKNFDESANSAREALSGWNGNQKHKGEGMIPSCPCMQQRFLKTDHGCKAAEGNIRAFCQNDGIMAHLSISLWLCRSCIKMLQYCLTRVLFKLLKLELPLQLVSKYHLEEAFNCTLQSSGIDPTWWCVGRRCVAWLLFSTLSKYEQVTLPCTGPGSIGSSHHFQCLCPEVMMSSLIYGPDADSCHDSRKCDCVTWHKTRIPQRDKAVPLSWLLKTHISVWWAFNGMVQGTEGSHRPARGELERCL